MEAAIALTPIAERIPVGIDVAQAIERLRRYTVDLLADAGLPELVALVGAVPVAEVDGNGAGSAAAPAPTRRVRPREASARPREARTRHTSTAGDSAGEIAPRAILPKPDRASDQAILPKPDRASDQAYDFVGIVMAKSAEATRSPRSWDAATTSRCSNSRRSGTSAPRTAS